MTVCHIQEWAGWANEWTLGSPPGFFWPQVVRSRNLGPALSPSPVFDNLDFLYFFYSIFLEFNIVIFRWMIANEEYLFHITDLSVRLSNSFFWPTEVSLHQIVELVVVRREELSGWRGFIQLGSWDREMISSLGQCSAGKKSGP